MNDLRVSKKSFILKQKIHEWLVSTSLHGFPHLANNKSYVLKSIWSICILLAITFCSLITLRTINEYLAFEVNTVIREFPEGESVFPMVSICRSKQISSTFTYDRSLPVNINIYNRFSSLLTAKNTNNVQNESDSFEDFFVFCGFSYQLCNRSHFVRYVDRFYGTCYRFNSGFDDNGNKIPLLKVSGDGYYSALILELFTGSLENHDGFHVVITNNSIQPIYNEGIEIRTNILSNIGIKRTYIKQQQRPYSDCINFISFNQLLDQNSKEFISKIDLTKYKYRQKYCLVTCLQNSILEKCGCMALPISNLTRRHANSCLTSEEVKCALEVRTLNVNEKTCLKACPLECESMRYDVSKSYSRYPSPEQFVYLKEYLISRNISPAENISSLSNQKIGSLFASLNLYYHHLKYTEISELPYQTEVGLISSIGGTLGLGLGLSLLSFVELIELFLRIIIVLIRPKQQRKILVNPAKIEQ